MVKHLWFDFAGTLYKETPDFTAAHDKFRFQTYADLQDITDLKVAEKEFLDLYKQYSSNSAAFRALGQPSDYWIHALDEFDFAALLKPNPEVSKTIAQLSITLPISLFTNFVRRRIDLLLQHLEIPEENFTHILSGDDVAERKPALEGFHKMVELSGIPANEILYIGDREDVDIKPAKEVGMQTCLLYGNSEVVDYSLGEFSDILGIIT